jgi:predicted NUDIX family phosphoesterase
MKHPQHIVAFDKKAFGVSGLGSLVRITPKSFFEAAYRSLFIGRRHELETDERFGQFLPYVVLRNRAADGLDRFFEYQRTSKVGEGRLGGKKSIGVGGHVDLIDVKYDSNSIIDVVATTAFAVAREMDEEIRFMRHDNVEFGFDELRNGSWEKEQKPEKLLPKFELVINDQSDAVGRVHYGVVMTIDVPDGFTPFCKEPELNTIGWRTAEEIKADDLENWSRLLIEDEQFSGGIPF